MVEGVLIVVVILVVLVLKVVVSDCRSIPHSPQKNVVAEIVTIFSTKKSLEEREKCYGIHDSSLTFLLIPQSANVHID